MAVTLSNTTRLMGLSTEKPESMDEDNAMYLELDTGDLYYWDGDSWEKVGGE